MSIMSVFTIYNCGTAFHANSGDIISKLWGLTPRDQCHINDGPGGGTFKPNRFGGRSNPGGASKLGGMLFGSGLEKNVDNVVEMLYLMRPMPRVLNMCGWSRGAITCAKIANKLSQLGPPLSQIAVNIFAIDPVPGSNTGGGSNWKNIAMTPNVRYYHTVLAQHDRRGLVDDAFQAVYPAFSANTNLDVDIMPGTHSSIVTFDSEKNDTAELVFDMAYRFLTSRGTRFSGGSALNNYEILRRYARIQENFEFYARLKAKHMSKLAQNPNSYKRVIMDATKTVVGSLSMAKPDFFINEHHRETFRMAYPNLGTELERTKLGNPFASAAASAEFDRMGGECPEQGKTLLLYFLQALK
jgi:hypothetical protein